LRLRPDGKPEIIVELAGGAQQLDLKYKGRKRFLYTVCCDSGRLLRIDVDRKKVATIAKNLRHPVGVVVDAHCKFAYVTDREKGALIRIKLSSGVATKLCSDLHDPSFLAWSGAGTVLCALHDSAHSLIKIDLGPPVAATRVAFGLPFQTTGVALDRES